MKNMDPTEVLNDNMEFLVDSLKRELRCLGKMNGLSDSQISDMERDFIARLAFAAIIGDEEEPEKEPEKEPEEEPEKEPEDLPKYVVRALSYINDHCNKRGCHDCIFCDLNGCKLEYLPYEWRLF